MSSSYTITEATTFTVTHAKHIASKIATDLARVKRFYESPSDERISAFETEAIALLKAGYLGVVTYGFKRGDTWIEPTLRYSARELADGSNDDNPGRIRSGYDISGATFYSYLTYSPAWDRLSDDARRAFKAQLPFQRGGASEPGVDGHFVEDRTYSSGGRGVSRSSLRSYK